MGADGDSIQTSIYNLLAEVNIDPKAEVTTLDLQLNSEETVELTVLGPEGKPLGGTEVQGVGDRTMGMALPQESAKVMLLGLTPNGSRRVTVRHVGKKLAGSMIVDTKAGPSQAIKLVPWGGVQGRIVKPDGTPWDKLNLVAGTLFGKRPRQEPFDTFPQGATYGSSLTDSEGRFQIGGLVPGMNYSASVGDRDRPFIGGLFDDVTIESGEVKALGDLQVRPFPPRTPATK